MTNRAIGFYDGDGDGLLDGMCAPGEEPAIDGCDLVLTPTARADVTVKPGMFTIRGLVVGKVYRDGNGDGFQNPGEPGVPGVRIILETGVSVTTDAVGKFSLSNLSPGQHVLRMDPLSLPNGWKVGGLGGTRLIDMALGGMFTVNFALHEE